MPIRSELVRRVTLLVTVILVTACAGPRVVPPESVGLSSEKLNDIHALLDGLVAKKSIAGAVALVAREGKAAYLDAVGWQDAEAAVPMATDTIFRICSMTKPVTSVAVMIVSRPTS